MKDLMGLMNKAKEMQTRMAELQEEIATLEATGQSGGGMVRVTLNGKGELKSMAIDPSMLKEGEGEILEDLIIAAHAEAKAKIDVLMQEKTSELTAGMGLPGGKLPF